MTEREFDRVKAYFDALPKESQQILAARIIHGNGLDENEVFETLDGMRQQQNIDAANKEGTRQERDFTKDA